MQLTDLKDRFIPSFAWSRDGNNLPWRAPMTTKMWFCMRLSDDFDSESASNFFERDRFRFGANPNRRFRDNLGTDPLTLLIGAMLIGVPPRTHNHHATLSESCWIRTIGRSRCDSDGCKYW